MAVAGRKLYAEALQEGRLRIDRAEALGGELRRRIVQRGGHRRGVRDFNTADGQGTAEAGARRDQFDGALDRRDAEASCHSLGLKTNLIRLESKTIQLMRARRLGDPLAFLSTLKRTSSAVKSLRPFSLNSR